MQARGVPSRLRLIPFTQEESMAISEALAAELKVEAATTRRLLERIPEDQFAWKPHEKSMTLERLSGHIAELPKLFAMVLTQDDMDFGTGNYQPFAPQSTDDLVTTFDKNVAEALNQLGGQSDDAYAKTWRMRNGEKVFFELPRMAALRSIGLNHLIHHRGQLSVYLRLLDVSLPSIYGPSADDSAGF
jgi:uncharacterized damage-inducible protein DinB